uniref:Sulfotransferase n=1 Tax=Oryza brachyantha TaxID=4533 RepID=J3MMT5_ORYBR
MSTHASYAVLPASITENSECKIIYIHRQPKDMLISYWHFMKPKLGEDYTATSISDVWRSISEEKYFGSPIWEHILGYWYASKTKSDSVLFLQYDELLHNPVKNVEKIAEFIGQPFSDAEREAGIVDAIVRLCSFEMLKDLGVNRTGFTGVGNARVPNELFFRKGTAGDWVNHVTPEMSESLDRFLSEKFHGSGFSLQ